jgi:LPXTG-site transpeptidase (sortase) family protein
MHTYLRIVAAFCIIGGLLGLIPLRYFDLKEKAALAQGSTSVSQTQLKPDAITGHPVAISIPSLNINLSVIDGTHNPRSGEWTLTTDKAQFATITTPPNNKTGNTLIYGHYRPEVFAYLHLIKPGGQAIITTDNGYKFTYNFINSQAVDPADTAIFKYKGAPRLTIQTCSGAFMQHRQLYYFKLSGYEKAKD